MKKLLFVASALAALSLLAPSSGFAQHEYDNQLGVYFDTGATDYNKVIGTSTPFAAYLILTQPVGNDSSPVTRVDAFETMLTFSNGASVFKLGEILPPGTINIGDANSPASGLEYICGIPVALDVVSEAVVLCEWNFMVLADTPIDLFIGNSNPGFLRYQNRIDSSTFELVDCYPSSGNTADPVASFNGAVTPTESETWGGVKSLYR